MKYLKNQKVEKETKASQYKEYQKNEDSKKFRQIKIKPEYLFSQMKMNKINKLREIFLEYDKNNSSKFNILL